METVVAKSSASVDGRRANVAHLRGGRTDGQADEVNDDKRTGTRSTPGAGRGDRRAEKAPRQGAKRGRKGAKTRVFSAPSRLGLGGLARSLSCGRRATRTGGEAGGAPALKTGQTR